MVCEVPTYVGQRKGVPVIVARNSWSSQSWCSSAVIPGVMSEHIPLLVLLLVSKILRFSLIFLEIEVSMETCVYAHMCLM